MLLESGQSCILCSPEEMHALGKKIGAVLTKGSVLALTGNLGTGKTTFVKGLGTALGIEEASINSPTFTYLNVYEGSLPLYHFDLYRLRSAQEFLDAGFAEFLPLGIACIEWPEHARPFLPAHTKNLLFTHINLDTRKIEVDEKAGI